MRTTAAIMAANGVTAYRVPALISPVPTLSWAVRDLGCSGGICMTASHNPAPYNGYKAYGPDGCQITSQAAAAISAAIAGTDAFTGVKSMDFDEAVASGKVKWIEDAVLERYYDAVLAQSVNNLSDEQIAAAPLKLVYTPLNGTGTGPRYHGCSRACWRLRRDRGARAGAARRQLPHLPVPQPRDPRGACSTGIDAVRASASRPAAGHRPRLPTAWALPCKDGDDYTLLTGNEMGVLLLDYVLRACAKSAAYAT